MKSPTVDASIAVFDERRIQAEKEERIERLRLEHEATMAKLQAEKEERLHQEHIAEEERLRVARETQEQRVQRHRERTTQEDLLGDLQGNDTVTLEIAAQVLGYDDTRYVVRLCTQDKLKHGPRRADLITVASLRAYLAKHSKRNATPLTMIKPNEEEGGEQNETTA